MTDSTNNSINIDDLTKEVNSNITTNSNNKDINLMKYLNKCLHTPFLYFTTVPLSLCILIYIIDPNYIYDINQDTDKKKFNCNKFSKLVIVGSIITNLFIYCQFKKKS